MADQLPVLEVLAGMDWDSGERIEAGRGAEEGAVQLGDEYAAGIGMEARQYRIVKYVAPLRQ